MEAVQTRTVIEGSSLACTGVAGDTDTMTTAPASASSAGQSPGAFSPSAQWRALRSTRGTSRRALVSAWTGFFVDMVDVYVPVIALAPALVYFQPDSLTAAQASMLFYATFAATLLGRPFGALIFGHLADTVGRRRVTLWSIAGFSVCTILIGCLPGYAQLGLAAPALLIALRFVDGVFLGGEYTAATPLAFEHCPAAAKGLFGGLLMGAYAMAYVAISTLVLLLLTVMPAETYVAWGWRLPFLLGGLLGLAFLAYRAKVPESDRWRDAQKEAMPLRALLLGSHRRDFAQVVALMTGLWLIATSVVTIMPRLLATELGRSHLWITATLLATQVLVFIGFATAGTISQMVGATKVLTGGATLAGTIGLLCYYLLVATPHPPLVDAGLVIVTQVLVLSVWGVVTSYCTSRFVTAVRASGFGVAYSVGLIPASFFAVYIAGLSQLMPSRYTQLVLLAVGAGLTIGAAVSHPRGAGSATGDGLVNPKDRAQAHPWDATDNSRGLRR